MGDEVRTGAMMFQIYFTTLTSDQWEQNSCLDQNLLHLHVAATIGYENLYSMVIVMRLTRKTNLKAGLIRFVKPIQYIS